MGYELAGLRLQKKCSRHLHIEAAVLNLYSALNNSCYLFYDTTGDVSFTDTPNSFSVIVTVTSNELCM